MSWDYFIYFAIIALICWILGAVAALKNAPTWKVYLPTIAGLLIFFAFIISLWIGLERPPMLTMGETRLWYSFFLPVAGIITYSRRKYKWILSFSVIMAFIFICINIFNPEIHSKTLIPSLQSPWFVPHVIVYMFAYAMMGAAVITSVYLLFFKKNAIQEQEMEICDNLVYTGLAFMTLGMMFGALWAKEAWGSYWTWDPKEIWAAATWLIYLIYIHFRMYNRLRYDIALLIMLFAFLTLQICWYGINWLPSARGSGHLYENLKI